MTIVLVAGLGRCGSTAMMKAIDATGYPVFGSPPSYEDDRALKALLGPPSLSGPIAMKWLDPHLDENRIPPGDYRGIFLTRDHHEQARSMLRFTGTPENRQSVRAVSRGLARDEPKARSMVRLMTRGQFVTVRFEDMVREPMWAMRLAALILSPDLPGRSPEPIAYAMADAIHVRRDAALRTPWERTLREKPL